MKQKLLSFLLLCATLFSSMAYAQDRRVTGKVIAEDGTPLPGVSIRITGNNTGVQTDADGNYSILVPGGSGTLEFSFLGHITQSKSIGSASTVNVTLSAATSELSEVIVTGYGNQIKKREVTGSVAVLSGDDIRDLPMQTFDKAMQGRLAGVQVTTNSGQPGSGVTINIRGTSTINGSNDPLYIVDGVQMSPGGLSTQTTQNRLGSINPSDIESIQVLKDAASASIYGSQAANGVVIITTRKGKAGKTNVRFSVQQGANQQLNPYELTTAQQWYDLRVEAVVNQRLRTGQPVASGITAFNNTLFGTPETPTNLQSTDWYDAIFRNGHFGIYDISFRGGDQKTKFFVSGGFQNQNGTLIESNYKRGNVRANLDHQVSNKFSLETNLTLTGTKSTGPTTGAGFYTNTPFTGSIFIPPINPIYNADGTYNQNIIQGYGINIVQGLLEESRETATIQSVSSLALNYDLIPGLRLRAFGGIDFADAKNYNYRPSSIPLYAPNGGTGNENFIRQINWNASGTASYNKTFGENHNFGAMGGFEYRDYTSTQLSVAAQNFPSPLLTLLSSAAVNTDYGSTFTGYKLASIISNVRYDYKGKYLLSGNLRYDGSSRFGADNKYGLFGGVSLGWQMADEDFLKDNTFINELKPKVSYGSVGDQSGIGNFQSLTLFGSPGASGAYDGQGSLRPGSLGFPQLTWESVNQLNLGLDFGLFNNRLFGSFDIYRTTRTDLLLNRTLPNDSGFGSIMENGGKVRAEGIDLELGSVNIDKGGFKWATNFNISFLRNELIELAGGQERIGNSYIVGQPLNIIWTYRYAGVNPADGRPMYYDANNNVTYLPVTADQQQIGDTNADFFGGLINNFSYKGLTLDVMFQYQYGNWAYLQMAQRLETSGMYAYNQVVSQVTDVWRTPGQITSEPRPYPNGVEPGGYNAINLSSRYVQKASYIRLKQITLAYKLPTSIGQKIGIPGISLFVQGLNLATITNYRGEEPENNNNNNLNGYPLPRQFAGGITLDF